MRTVRTEIDYSEKGSRLELLVRLVYCPLLVGISAFLSATFLAALALIHGLHILLLGKRHPTLHRLAKTIILYGSRANYYTFLLTDERPPLIPELE